MNVSDFLINDLSLSPSGGKGNNRVCYAIQNRTGRYVSGFRKAIFPSYRKMRSLAKRFLGCEYLEDIFPDNDRLREEGYWIFFSIDGKLSMEKRVAFLAAVAVNTTFEQG